MGVPIPELSAPDVRDTFSRMGMDDRETVALIGGGHAFGKTHGACPAGAGPSPEEDPANPWPGLCGSGRGADTFTSGFEGPWVPTPTTWSNSYYRMLLDFDWEVHVGPGNHSQWRVAGAESPTAPGVEPGGPREAIMMLTSDISLLNDPLNSYQQYVSEFAEDQEAFDTAFAAAWYGPLNCRTAARTLFLRPYLARFCPVFSRFFAVFSVLTPGFQKVAPKDSGPVP